MNSDDSNDIGDIGDKELDAFLRGEDALSERLRAMPQPQPPAGLDAAILARARRALEDEPRPAAANDPAPPAIRRWRVPAGLAAMLLVGVLTHRTWEETGQMQQVDAPAPPEPVSAPAPAPAAAEVQAQQAPPPPVERAAQKAAPAAKPQEQVVEVDIQPASVVPPAQVQVPEQRAPAPQSSFSNAADAAPRPQLRVREEAPRPAPPAPVMAAPAPPPAPAAPAASAAAGPTPEAWIELIEAMLAAGLKSDTLAEWDAFRAAHPAYPVDPELEAKISALRKR